MKNLNSIKRERLNLSRYMGETNLHLGCGTVRLDGFVNIDYYNKTVADMVFNFNGVFPFPNAHADLIFSDNLLEHIPDQLRFVEECLRVLKPGGYFIAKAPYFKSNNAFIDPTHVKCFTIQSFDYYLKDSCFNRKYRFFNAAFSELSIGLDIGSISAFKNLLANFAIRHPNGFENSILSSLFIFQNVVYIARK